MRISSSDTVIGYPILRIRRVLEKCQAADLIVSEVERLLKVDQSEAHSVLSALEQEGYIELCAEYLPHEQWRTTLKGNTLANASAARPVSRTKAQLRLKEFMDRVEQVNAHDLYVYRVAKVALFGSMLSESPTVGDIDLAVQLEPKYELTEMSARREQRVAAAREAGKIFSNSVDRLLWPHTEVWLVLRNRSHVISLHRFDELMDLNTPFKLLLSASDA